MPKGSPSALEKGLKYPKVDLEEVIVFLKNEGHSDVRENIQNLARINGYSNIGATKKAKRKIFLKDLGLSLSTTILSTLLFNIPNKGDSFRDYIPAVIPSFFVGAYTFYWLRKNVNEEELSRLYTEAIKPYYKLNGQDFTQKHKKGFFFKFR